MNKELKRCWVARHYARFNNNNNNGDNNNNNNNNNNGLISVHPWYGSSPDIKVK